MKIKVQRIIIKTSSFLVAFTLSFGVFLAGAATPVFAAANLYVSPASKTINNGDTLTIQVRTNTGGDPVNAVQANLSYSAQLQFVSIDDSGSAFDIEAQATGGGGSVKIARGDASPKSGDLLIAKVNFKAISGGYASVSFASGSAVLRSTDNTNILSGTSSGNYTVNVPASPPPAPSPPPPGGGDSGGSTTSGGTAPTTDTTSKTTTPTKSTGGLEISDVNVGSIGTNSATITWKTNRKASSTVEFGSEKRFNLKVEDGGFITDHKLAIPSKFLVPGATYIFRVKGKDEDGNAAESKALSFTTKGYTVIVNVVDTKGDPLKGVTVTLFSDPKTAVTDENGQATFKDVYAGEHEISVLLDDGGEVKDKITVAKDDVKQLAAGKLAPQSFQIQVNTQDFTLYFTSLGLLILVEGVLMVVLLIHRDQRRKQETILKDEVVG